VLDSRLDSLSADERYRLLSEQADRRTAGGWELRPGGRILAVR
jgi:hypothetical protein